MAYCIGLDCGTTSVGWAALELDSNEEPRRIINLGSRIFTAAENSDSKKQPSLALPRREKRSLRRRIRRHRHRNERIRNLIVSSGILNEEDMKCLFDGRLTDIYLLRAQALDRLLTNGEFARVLINIAQRRGFKSNRKNTSDKDEGALLSAVDSNLSLMGEKGYRTVGEMLYKDEKFAEHKRNKGSDYSNTVSRVLIEDEIHQIFEAQRHFGNKNADEKFEAKYSEIVLSQRSFEEGPGEGSKYGGNQIEKMRGKCTFEPEEPRAPKASYSFQLFTLWQKINSIKITGNGESRFLTDEERREVFELAHKKADLKVSDVRKRLGIEDNYRFNIVSYPKDKDTAEAEKAKFNYLKAYHDIRKALDKVSKGRIKYYSREMLDAIGEIFTLYKNDDTIQKNLKLEDEDAKKNYKCLEGLDKEDIDCLMSLGNFSKFGHISVKACNALIPFLEQGMTYDKACEAVGYDFKAHDCEKSKYLSGYAPEFENLTNPVVKRAVSQTIKVINAIVREQGESPVFINIELARDMSKTRDERKSNEKRIEENRNKNEKAMAYLRNELKVLNPTGMDLVKYKLWQEQDGYCPYSGKRLEIERIFEQGYAEVDHIFPYSISFDDSYNNKVLVLAAENRNKGNRLPLQYLTDKRREDYIVWVNANVKNFRKKQIMLKEKISEEDAGLKERSLQDTRFLSRFLYNYITDHMEFAPSTRKNKQVTSVNGAVTAFMRKRWGIVKIREDGDLHHAADAVVIACVTQGMIKKISDYSKYREVRYSEATKDEAAFVIDSLTGEVVDRFPYPWQGFRKELEIRLSNDPQSILCDFNLQNYTAEEQAAIKPCFVSRMPTRKTKGAAHKDTVRSPRLLDQGLVLSKKPLTELKLGKDGEIEGYYNPQSDRLLYEALKNRLVEFNGDAKKAFEKPFYKPASTGENGPVVKKVKIYEKSSLNVSLNDGKGVAANDNMVRIDVFYVENDGYYFVPIYVADTVKPELPNKAVVQAREWKEMDDKDFVFSLYPNDAVLVKSKKEIKLKVKLKDSTLPKEHNCNNELLYYSGADISNASLNLETHDSAYRIHGMGIKSLLSFEKYEVDPLGNCRKVVSENRQRFGKN